MKTIAEADWQSEGPIIRGEVENIPGAVEDRRAYLAVLKMALDLVAQFFIHGAVDVIGDIAPDMLAVQLHSDLPNNPRRGAKEIFSNGTSRLCSSMRARCSRTFTTLAVTPRTLAVSSTFRSS